MSQYFKEERPWGSFEILYEESGLKVKRITVHSGQRLSLQSHTQRQETWTLLSGRAEVQLDNGTIVWLPHQCVFIAREIRHRVKNVGIEPVVFIEVQEGPYLGEDDITRFEDDYKRI
jgi:mannose-6-phosphate isomerase